MHAEAAEHRCAICRWSSRQSEARSPVEPTILCQSSRLLIGSPLVSLTLEQGTLRGVHVRETDGAVVQSESEQSSSLCAAMRAVLRFLKARRATRPTQGTTRRQQRRALCATRISGLTLDAWPYTRPPALLLTTRHQRGGGGAHHPPNALERLGQIFFWTFGQSKFFSGAFGAKYFEPKNFLWRL